MTTDTKARRRPFGTIETRGIPPRYFARFVWQARRIRRASMSRAIAAQKLAAAHAALDRGVDLREVLVRVFNDAGGSRLTFRDASALFLEAMKPRWKASTLAGNVKRLRVLLAAPWAGGYLSAIRPEDFSRWVQTRMGGKRPASSATVNRDLSLASALYSWAVRLGYVEANPLRRVQKLDERGRERETYLTAGEVRALLDKSSVILRPMLAFAFSTGARLGEILRLEWRDVDFNRNEVLIRPEVEKSGRGRVIGLTADLRAALKALDDARKVKAIDGSDCVFVDAEGKTPKEWAIRSALKSALTRADSIPLEKRSRFCFHSCRHTAASLLVAAGVPIHDVAKLLGHGSVNLTHRRYAHFAPEAGRAAVDKLGKALSLAGEAGGVAVTAKAGG